MYVRQTRSSPRRNKPAGRPPSKLKMKRQKRTPTPVAEVVAKEEVAEEQIPDPPPAEEDDEAAEAAAAEELASLHNDGDGEAAFLELVIPDAPPLISPTNLLPPPWAGK